MSPYPTYSYAPLLPPHNFRLFILHPSADLSAPITGSLIPGTLESYDTNLVDHYAALSYVWGDASLRRVIHVDGLPLEITVSLDSALRHIRDATRELHVWADGICINQRDEKDKNAQVGHMGLIFEGARNTVIFLGESEGTGKDMEVLEWIRRVAEGQKWNGLQQSTQAGVPPVMDQREAMRNQATDYLLNKTWFSRVWIFQELVLSLCPWVQVSRTRVRWIDMNDALMGSAYKPVTEGPLKRFYDMTKAAVQLRPQWVSPHASELKWVTLLQLLKSRRGAGVSDARDMVYAHLGMLRSRRDYECPLEESIKIDYGKSVGDLYTDAAIYFMRASAAFVILPYVEDVCPEMRRKGVPSWVPDWTEARVQAGMEMRQEQSNLNCGTFSTCFRPENVLACSGSKVSVIQRLKEDMLPTFDIRTLRRPAGLLLTGGSNSEEDDGKDEAGPEEYKHLPGLLMPHLLAWLGPQHHFPFWLSGSGSLDQWIYEFGGRSALNDLDKCLKFVRHGARIPPMTNGRFSPQGPYHTLPYVLFEMLDQSGHGCFPGRKLAITENSGLAWVPKFAKEGDVLFSFSGSYVPFLLRRVCSTEDSEDERKRRDELDQKTRDAFPRIAATSKVDHFTFLGECIYDPWASEPEDMSPETIFLLH